jgi:dihydroxyacetone kinase
MTAGTEPLEPSAGLADLLSGVTEALAGHRDALNRLDAVAGDGDLGLTVAQAAEAIAEIAPTIRGLPTAEAIRAVGAEIARKAPSTSGTLVAFSFLAAARVGDVDAETASARAIPYLEAGAESIATRGKVSVGDRTMLDAIRPGVDAFRSALEQGEPVAKAARAAAIAADEGARATASMTPTVGRSAWLVERARGHEDAGARLVALAFDAAARYLEGGTAACERGSG